MARTAEQLCSSYRKHLARLYGEDVAAASIVAHDYGRYHVGLARRAPNGEIVPPSMVIHFTRKAFLRATRVLNKWR